MAGSNVASVTKLLVKVNEGFITTLGSTISSGATTVPLADVTDLTNGSTFVGIIEPGGTKQQVFTGTVDTGTLEVTGVKWTRGSNTAHAGGVTIVDYVTGTAINMLTKWAAVEHNDNGTHGNITATTVTVSGDVSADDITSTTLTTTGDIISGDDLAYDGWMKPTPTVSSNPSTLTPNSSLHIVTGLAQGLTIAAPTGAFAQGSKLLIRIKDDGTARALTWNAIFRAGTDVPLPTTTVISKTMYVGFIYNSTDTKWDCIVSMGNI